MAFMQPEIVYGEWCEIETDHGAFLVPAEDAEGACANAPNGAIAERKQGYGARLSAPGYLDCTEWTVFATEDEARTYLTDTYCECGTGDDPDETCELCQELGN